jgi:hypothetical protein
MSELVCGRYECTEGGSDKFWEIKFVGKDTHGLGYNYEVRYGKNGTFGRVHPKLLGGAEAKKKIAEKLGKGYELVERYTTPWKGDKVDSEHHLRGIGEGLSEGQKRAKKKIKNIKEKNEYDFMEELKAL